MLRSEGLLREDCSPLSTVPLSLRRADHSSRGVLPTVVHRCVWSRNLESREALAYSGLSRQKQNKSTLKVSELMTNRLCGWTKHEREWKAVAKWFPSLALMKYEAWWRMFYTTEGCGFLDYLNEVIVVFIVTYRYWHKEMTRITIQCTYCGCRGRTVDKLRPIRK